MAKGMLLSASLAAIWIFSHILVVNLFRPRAVFHVSSLLYAATLPLFVLLYWITPTDLYVLPASASQTKPVLGFLNGFVLHLFFYGTWWQVFFPIDRSLTLRIMIEFLNCPDGVLTYERLRSVYSFEDMVMLRLEGMKVNGYVLEDSAGRYSLTLRGKILTDLMLFFRRCFKGTFYLLDHR